MPAEQNIKRNIAETGENLYINRWWTGEVTQRSPLFTPVSALGLQIISRHDTLAAGGSNMELSPIMTLARRYGYSRFCSAAFGASDYPLGYFSYLNTAGTLATMVDTPTMVASFTSSAISSLYSKGTTNPTSFAKVGDYVYMCDGTNAKKWNQTTLSNWGIAAPLSTPTLSFVSGSLSPTVGYQYVYVYKNSSTAHISTASPVSAVTGPLTSKNISVGYTASSDSQVTNIDIYRTKDGGAVFYFLAEVSNATSSYTDSSPDSSLNVQLIAPQAGMNNPPPTGISLVTWHNDRLFGAVKNVLYMSSGPDATNGVQMECWNPSYTFVFPAGITSLNTTPFGLAVFTQDGAFLLQGTNTLSYYPSPWLKNFGVANKNCVAHDQSNMYVYTRRSQLWQIGADASLTEVGFPVGDQLLASFSPNSSYLAMHRNGNDVGLYISNGSTILKRYSPNYNAWDPTATITGGVGAIASIEGTSADWMLFIGRPTASGYILKRDTTLYTDDGSTYTCNAVVGSLLIAPPGETARLTQVLTQTMPVGTYPTVGLRLNEIGGSFATLPNPVNDPPKYDSTAFASVTVTSKRHYLKAATTPVPEEAQHLQIQLSFIAENARGEILGLGIQ
jgi:hypothetical protein